MCPCCFVKVEEGESEQQWGSREEEIDEKQQFMLRLRVIEGKKRDVRRVSELGWGTQGWTGRQWGGRHVGCPELPDGSEWFIPYS